MSAAIIESRLREIEALALRSGSHEEFEQGMCVMEAVSYVAGEPWSDAPQCACPVITAFMVSWNDNLPSDANRDRLLKRPAGMAAIRPPWDGEWQVVAINGYVVAACPGALPGGPAETIANARLTAAAPAMRSALEQLHRICRDCDLEVQSDRPTEESYIAAMDAAEAALAAATP